MLQRYWINQPSKLQTHHTLHGENVLAEIHKGFPITTVYFTSGPMISYQINHNVLSEGWK